MPIVKYVGGKPKEQQHRPRPSVPAVGSGDFRARVVDRAVDLVRLIDEGVAPVEYLPASENMLVRSARHQVPAPKKTGKSIGMQSHFVRMGLAGANVVILDRENGELVYGRRLEAMFDAWEVTDDQREQVRARLTYVPWPTLRKDDGPDLVQWAQDLGADLVVFDAQRMFLTDLGLKEGEADDYATFMAALIDPLAQAGVATLILDNTGFGDQERSRGSSAKGDLNEVLFVMREVRPFSVERVGELALELPAGGSRHGHEGEWRMEIGGGRFGAWVALDAQPIPDDFRRAAIAVSKAAGGDGLSQSKLLKAIRQGEKVSVSNADVKIWLDALAADPTAGLLVESRGQAIFYRHVEESHGERIPSASMTPETAPGAVRPKTAPGAVRRGGK